MYKRQMPKRALNPWFKVSPPARSARGMRSPGPVSYTHLDVYKRQLDNSFPDIQKALDDYSAVLKSGNADIVNTRPVSYTHLCMHGLISMPTGTRMATPEI